jgi:hypothetical protein
MTAMIPVELLCSNANTSSADFRVFVQAAYQATGRPKRPQRAVVCRSLYRWILPVDVLGSSGMNSIQRGYL